MRKCSATTRKGHPCKGLVKAGSDWCPAHDPRRADERIRVARIAAKARHSRLGREIQGVKDLTLELVTLLVNNRLGFAYNYLTYVIQLLNTYLRSTEIQLRLEERPLNEAYLDVGTLKTQILERVEELENRESERQEHLSGLAHIAEEYGLPLNTEALT